MDVTFTNVLEGARQYFQGLPAAPSAAVSSPEASTKITSEITNSEESEQQSHESTQPAAGSMPPQTRQAGDQSPSETGDDNVQTAPTAREDAANVSLPQNEKEDETTRSVPPEKTDPSEKPSTTSISSPCLTPTTQLSHIPTPNSYMSSPGPPLVDASCRESNPSTVQQTESKSEDVSITETNKSNVLSEVQSNVSSVSSDRQVQNDINFDKPNNCTIDKNESEIKLSVNSEVSVETNRSDNKVLQKPCNTTDVQSFPSNKNEPANEIIKPSSDNLHVMENSTHFPRNDRESSEENYHLSYKILQAPREHSTAHFNETQNVRPPFQIRPPSSDTRTQSSEIRPSSREVLPSTNEVRQTIDVRPSSTEVRPLSSEIKITPNERIGHLSDTNMSATEMRHVGNDMRFHLNEGRPVTNDSRISQVHEMYRPPSLESRITQVHELRPVQTYEYRSVPVQDERSLVTLEPRINSTDARCYDARSASNNNNPILYNKPYSTNQNTQENRPASVEYISTQQYRALDGRPSSQEIKQQYDNKTLNRRSLSNEQRPSSRGSRPQSHEFRPPSHEMRPPSLEMRPPSHEMRPPSHEMRPPSHEMRPPSHEMRPPSHEMRPPSHELRPQSHEMRHPSQEIRLTPQEVKTSSQEFRPSHEMRSSHEMRPHLQESRSSQEFRPSPQEVRLVSHELRPYSHELRPAHELRIPLQDMRQATQAHERSTAQDVRNVQHEIKQVSSHEIKQVPQETRQSNREIRQMPQEHSKHVPHQEFQQSTHAPDIRQQQVPQEFRNIPQELRVSQNQDYRQPHEARIATYDNRQNSRDYRVLSEYQRAPTQSQDVRTHQPDIRTSVQDTRSINARLHDSRTYSHQVPMLSQEYRPPVPHEQPVSVRTSSEQNTTNDARLYRPNYEYLQAASNSRNLSVYPQMISKSKTSSGEQTPHINSQSFSQAMSRISADTNSTQHHNQQGYYIPSKQTSAVQHSVKMVPNPYVQNNMAPPNQQNVSDSRLNNLYIQSKPAHNVHDLSSGSTYISPQSVKQTTNNMNNHQIQHRVQEYERRIQTQGYPTTEPHTASKVKETSTKNVTNYSQIASLNRPQETNLMGYPSRETNELSSHNLKYNQMSTTHLAPRSQETSQSTHTYAPQMQSSSSVQQNTSVHHQPHVSTNYQASVPQRSTYSNAISNRTMAQQYAISNSQASSQYFQHGTQNASSSSHSAAAQYPYQKIMQQNVKNTQSQEVTYPTSQVQTSQPLKVTHNLPPIAALSSSANYLNKTNRDASHRLTQKHRSPSSSNMNPQQYVAKTHSVSDNASKTYLPTVSSNYNPSSIPHTISSYHSQSANGYPYLTTTAQSHNTTTTTSTSTGIIPSSSYPTHQSHFQYAKPALQEALIKRQQASQNPSKIHQSQSHPTLTSLGRTSTETHYGTTHNGQLRSEVTATAASSRIPTDPTQRSSKTKRESPLDLSVKTVRTSADSTADDDIHIIEQRSGKHAIQAIRPHVPSQNMAYDQRIPNHRIPIPTTVTAPRVDFSPDFSLNNNNARNISENHKLNAPRHPFDNKLYGNQAVATRKLTNDKTYDNRMPAYYQTLAQTQRAPVNNTQMNVQGVQGNNAYTPIAESIKRTDGLPRVDFPPLNQNHNNIYQSSTSSKDVQRKRAGEPVIPTIPNKIPRVDTWRQTIDQEIDQRLQLKKKELQQKEAQSFVNQSVVNGHITTSTTQQLAAPAHRVQIDVSQQYMNQYRPPLHQKTATQPVHTSTSHQQGHLQSPQSQTMGHIYPQAINQTHPQATSHIQTNHQQTYVQPENMYQHHQNQTSVVQNTHASTQNLPRSNSHSKLQHAGLPNHSTTNNVGPGADIRVINLLRTSLEKKEAKEAQKRIEQERMNANDMTVMQNRIRPTFQQPSTEVTAPVQSKPPSVGRHNLPPFQTSNMLEAAAQPSQKFHLPRAVDSIRLEMRNGVATPVNEKYAEMKTTTSLDNNYPVASVPPPSNIPANADLDGLAANLAARIRTKAELKQVDPSQLQMNRPATDETQVTSTPNEEIKSETDVQLSASTDGTSSNGSPPKLISERMPMPPRRRLFSRPEDEQNSVTGSTTAAAVSQRDSSLRSSSETSVFDFPDSDSEAEMHVMERSLDDLRRDRKSLTKQGPSNIDLEPPMIEIPEPPVIKEEICDDPPDPFFSDTCDKLLEQLRSGPKKRGRRKKMVEPDVLAKLETVTKERPLSEIEIKVEKCDDVLEKIEAASAIEIKKEVIEEMIEPKQEPLDDMEFKKEEDSDSDAPLIEKKNILGIKDKSPDVSDDSDDDVIRIKRKDGAKKSGAKIKLESSSESSSDSDSDENPETVADRLRQRKRQPGKTLSEKGMSLRPRETTPQKTRSKTALQKKPSFGDGSDFRPGWEEEVYKYKQSLRMPAQLIYISRPARVSSSLPDLDPCPSPAASSIADNEFFQQRRAVSNNLFGSCKTKFELFDSDIDSNSSFSLIHNKNLEDSEEATSSSLLSSTSKTNSKFKMSKNSNSIVDLLAQRYGKNRRKKTRKEDNAGPKIIPRAASPLELLPTPSLGIGSTQKEDKKGVKGKLKKIKQEEHDNIPQDSVYLGTFRKKTVNNFRGAFLKNAKSATISEAFKPIVLKSRTRKETRVLKQRATMREVFGEDRPASAPPMTNHRDIKKELPIVKPEVKKKPVATKTVKTKQKESSGTPGRAGLRSAIVLRGNRTLLTKRIIPAGRKKSMIKALEAKKLKLEMKRQLKGGKVPHKEGKQSAKEDKLIIKEEKITKDDKASKDDKSSFKEDKLLKDEKPTVKVEKMIMKEELKVELTTMDSDEVKPPHPPKKRMKLKAIRRKFSSGFDYIRKKKKQVKKEKVPTEGVIKIKKKRIGVQRSNAESVQDIQREIKGWVLNKGIGETHLHRAARLGYTDVTAYCLESLNNRPSPKDNAGYTPLHEACSRGHLDIAKLLLLYGANVHESAKGGIRPLHEATENGYVEIIRLLLAYGADPSLATYSGYTPMSLATDSDSLSLLQQYMADIQGKESMPWQFPGPAPCFDTEEKGYDALEGAPTPDPESSEEDFVTEECEVPLPNLYKLRGDNPNDRWVLMQDLLSLLKIKSKDALLRQINPPTTSSQPPGPVNHKNVLRELKMADFLEQGHCTHMLWAGERVNTRGSKVVLIRYNDRVKQLLGVEKSVTLLR